MNQDSEEMELGELSDETFDFKHITWKISDAFTLPDLVDYETVSPSFSFIGGTWKLGIYPNGQSEEGSEGYIDLFIWRTNYEFAEQDIFYKICFITKDGKEFKSYSDIFSFTPEIDFYSVIRYIKKSTFIYKTYILAPKGVLTIMCQIRAKKVAAIDRYDQKEPNASLFGCDCRLRKSTPLSVNKTLRDLKELFLKQEDCDVVIKVKGQEFPAHKLILTARSPVFASTFRYDMKEKATGTIDIEDCDPSSFSDFLCFLYCGNVEILTTDNVFGLFTAADKYDVQDLRLECLEFMKRNLSVDTFCETLTLALWHFEKELIDLTTDFFAKHWKEILVTVKWQSFIVENPIQGNEMMVKALILKKK